MHKQKLSSITISGSAVRKTLLAAWIIFWIANVAVTVGETLTRPLIVGWSFFFAWSLFVIAPVALAYLFGRADESDRADERGRN